MKKKLLLLACVLLAMIVWTKIIPSSLAQDDKLSGKWVGTIDHWMKGRGEWEKRSLTVKFRKTGNTYEGLFGTNEIKNISFDGTNISFSAGKETCNGRLTIDEIHGMCTETEGNDQGRVGWDVEKQ